MAVRAVTGMVEVLIGYYYGLFSQYVAWKECNTQPSSTAAVETALASHVVSKVIQPM